MGALYVGLDPHLLKALRRQLPLRAFFETGTYEAATTAAVAPQFDRVWTVELSPILWDGAKQKLKRFSHVEPIAGPSPATLRQRASELSSTSVLYWLDAHWCGGRSVRARKECPLLEELAAIGKLNDESVVLIDNARFFLGPPPAPHNAADWPGLFEIEAALHAISTEHNLWIINDVIIYAPKRIADDIVAYGQSYNVDLAMIAQSFLRGVKESGEKPSNPPASKAAQERGHGLDEGFNALLAQDRSERIFAFHAQRLGITRLLDVGANSGQFAAKLRRLGFDGVIHSVEPQCAAHAELRENAQRDVRWIPLSRQAAGRVPGRLDLNLSENSWSSSFLPVHDNHLRAAPAARKVAQERVFVTRTADLLRDPLMRKIDALKIDVQGYEHEVLQGLRSCMDGIRLVLLEMSAVECYVGAPDLFALDRFLVEELGFARVSLEPSYYDRAGVAQQFDGIYAKDPSSDALIPSAKSHAFGPIMTSMHGVPSRKDPSGEELGQEWLDLCVESWMQLSESTISIAETEPPDPRVTWIRTNERPSLADLFAAMPVTEDGHTVLCNADIVIADDLSGLSAMLDPETMYLAHRLEVEFNAANPQLLDGKGIYGLGFDLFLLPADFVRFVRDSHPFPPAFRLGEPWWDYLLPVVALAAGFPVKRLPRERTVAMHHKHPIRFGWDSWERLGEAFLGSAATLAAEYSYRGCDLLDDLNTLSGPLETRLILASGMVCSRLP